MQQPPNEGVATFTRQTYGGKNLSYRLKVVQQPEKARACGSGPRSSADRRPVDPPPVVKLTIFEDGEDITFKYDAGFMLYASLDVARPIAQGRMHHGQIVPVLTGVAVAGVAYLDRPKAAGYFIFPDLSVRHEGWYRLRFHLFEHVKHSEDADKDRPFETVQASTSDQPREPHPHEAMANRMFVYSSPFQVFSAKKFPGLNTSTELSKVVADQGCRVRIRREIRQRRKPKGKGEGEEEERKSIHGTPEPAIAHERSLSREDISRKISIDTAHIASRRPSIEHSSATTPIVNAPAPRPIPSSSPVSSMYPAEARPFPMAIEPESKAYMPPQPPAPAPPYPRTATPESSSLKLPSIHAFLNAAPAQSPRPSQYNLPAPTSQKRSYSPRTFSQDLSLKDGARPDTLPAPAAGPQPTAHMARAPPATSHWVMNDYAPIAKAGPIIEADTEGTSEDSDDDSILNGPFTYRRADGTRSGKPLVSLKYHH